VGVSQVGDAELAKVLESELSRTGHFLRELVRGDAIVREAIHHASPSLTEAIDAWLRQESSPRAHDIAETLLKYLARMSYRATPFGLFAGCSVGRVGDSTVLSLAPRDRYRRHTRVDFHFLNLMIARLNADPEARARVIFRPNGGIQRTPSEYRYSIAAAAPESSTQSYKAVSVARDESVDAALERARDGIRLDKLIGFVRKGNPGASREEAENFVSSLVESQLIVPDLSLTITAESQLGDLVAQLVGLGQTRVATALQSADAALRELDAGGLSVAPERYHAIGKTLEELQIPPKGSSVFHVDLHKPAKATLGPAVIREIERSVSLLERFWTGPKLGNYRAFRDDFLERYDTREVPLTEALDGELGIGGSRARMAESSPLLDGLDFPEQEESAKEGFAKRDARLLAGLAETLRSGAVEWTLQESDVKELTVEDNGARRPDAYSVIGTLVASSPAALESGDFLFYVGGTTVPGGAHMLARFCHGDAELRELVEAHYRAEEALRPEAVFAELVYPAERRGESMVCRPPLRPWEIHCLARGAADPTHTLALEDLTLSVREGRIVLRSTRLGREVVPAMSCTHDYRRSALAIPGFFGTLQEDPEVLHFDWGLLRHSPFLPRLVSGKTILSLARWKLSRADLKSLEDPDPVRAFRGFAEVRERLRLPRWVCLMGLESGIPLDLEHPLYLKLLALEARGRSGVTLTELLGKGELGVRGPEGGFASEIIVPFLRRAEAQAPAAARKAKKSAPPARLKRDFEPGSEWFYAKLYTGTSTADELLLDVVAPVIRAARAAGLARSWFFLRYGDPKFHLRLRILGANSASAQGLLKLLQRRIAPWLADRRVWRVQLDTYEREVERYGGPEGTRLAERIFEADSEAALGILRALRNHDRRPDLCALFALRGMDQLFDDLGLDLDARLELARGYRSGYAGEFKVGGPFEAQLSSKFRSRRAELEEFLEGARSDEPGVKECHAALANRSRAISSLVRNLNSTEGEARIGQERRSLAGDFAHLYVNRLLRADHRAQELVLYDFLRRIYESRKARPRTS
jgi:thiopeptide-type bacteriocin biosynthesis protein